MTYTVKYKLPDQLFWRTIKKLEGDGFVEHGKSRWFVTDDKVRIEIPTSARFVFSRERFLITMERLESEIGQQIKIKGV